MRGFLIHLSTSDSLPSTIPAGLDIRIEAWKRSVGEKRTRDIRCGKFSGTLCAQTDVGYDYNQIWKPDELNQGGCLYLGPRILLSEDELPKFPGHGTPADWARRSEWYTGGLETSVFLAYDRVGDKLSVKTDLLNSTFVYFRKIDGHILASNSSLLLGRLFGDGLEPISCLELLATGSIYGNRGLYRSVESLQPSRFYQWDSKRVRSEIEYWKFPQIPFGSLTLKDAKSRIIDSLDADFKKLGKANGNLVFDLTGGYDSRCNFGFALRNGLKFRTTVSGQNGDDDVTISNKLSRFYGIAHTCVPYWSGSEKEESELLARSQEYTDFEYDICEYAHILQVHEGHYGKEEISIHGSTADIMRNYFLLPDFYAPDPDGKLNLRNLISKKFPPGMDLNRIAAPGIVPDWDAHMAEEIARYDLPDLPAFARLDNIYLRIRMQFWQGRIASSTTRLHSSFTPWTNVDVLEAILATRWRDKENCMLSRALISSVHPGLSRFPLTAGSIPGIGTISSLGALPSKFKYYRSRLQQKLFRSKEAGYHPGGGRKALTEVAQGVEILEGILHPDAIRAIKGGSASEFSDRNPRFVQRLLTILRAAETVKK